MTITFFVSGIPRPGGSKRYLGHRGGKPIIVDDCTKNAGWRRTVAAEAAKEMRRAGVKIFPPGVPLFRSFNFYMPRPRGHFAKDGSIRPKCLALRPTTRPDAGKLARSTDDALTGIAWSDDAQIVASVEFKWYAQLGGLAGCRAMIEEASQ